MGRCNGYRPRRAVKEDVERLRAELSKCHSGEWQRASLLMRQITMLIGHRGGPMNGRIEPRACRYCHYFGHTKQYCVARKDAEQREMEAMVAEDAALRAAYATDVETDWERWCRYHNLARRELLSRKPYFEWKNPEYETELNRLITQFGLDESNAQSTPPKLKPTLQEPPGC